MINREATLILIEALAKSIEAKDSEIAEALRNLCRSFAARVTHHSAVSLPLAAATELGP